KSLAEKKYAAQRQPGAQGASAGSAEAMREMVAFFRQLAQRRASGEKLKTEDAPAPPRRSGLQPDPSERLSVSARIGPVTNRTYKDASPPDLRREVEEMRRLLQVLVAETPCTAFPADFIPHYRRLVDSGMRRTLAASLMDAVLGGGRATAEAAQTDGSDRSVLRNPRVFTERLRMEIQKRVLVTHGLPRAGHARRTVALIGPTGVGKTTNLAKLAALFAIRDRARVAIVTLDTYRVAAPEQLRVYATIAGLPMRIANDPAEYTRALEAFADCDFVFVDTAGSSPFNEEQVHELKAEFDAAPPDDVMLVLSAGTGAEDLRMIAARFGCLRPSSLFFSKLDETGRYGAMFDLAAESGLPLSYFSIGQNVPNDIETAAPSKLARLLLEEGGICSGSSAQSA
ncbi:MAG: hypothetical protein NTU83_13760, partial [Candidatus Hydrogenedentes bacterium]|nr:hypothetical protein [Candidatus Hydrogenedentota bacterium]